MASKALVLGITHLFLQFVTTFYGLLFMDMPDPAPGSLTAISLIVAGILREVLTFPVVQLVFKFTPLDTGYKIIGVFLGNSILWGGCLYLLLYKITGLRQERPKTRKGSQH